MGAAVELRKAKSGQAELKGKKWPRLQKNSSSEEEEATGPQLCLSVCAKVHQRLGQNSSTE